MQWLVVPMLFAAMPFATMLAGPARAADAEPAAAAAEAPPAWGTALLRKEPAWYGSAQARAVAANVLRYQSAEGAWPKNTNLAQWPPAGRDTNYASDGRANTIDNRATTAPMEFLARVYGATKERALREAFDRGFEYLLAAQYANGGWPQFFPLREGYYSHVTFNDDAMVLVLSLLREVAAGKPPFQFVEKKNRKRAALSAQKGLDVILRTQLKRGEALTAWCAQYDEHTLKPAWARAYEPPSLSGNESVGILRFLMGVEKPTAEVVAAVEGGVRWLRAAAIQGVRIESFVADDGKPDRRAVRDANAPPVWARFYEVESNEPMFLGRDSAVHRSFNDIERERRNGYGYYGTWPQKLLDEEHAAWRRRLGLPADAR